jgi:DNA-binding MarR family transcriptional regulator
MILWNPKQLAKELNIPQRTISRLLKALGAKRYTRSTYILEVDTEA